VLINKPNGTNVYPGTPKDYTGNDVTPENFLKILQGESMEGVGTGKTLHSTANDRVFVYFADHGATGLVAFPVGELYAKDLNDALKNMHTQNKYSQLVFYMEACESGSMFNELLPKDINVYALTASNPFESSWGCYCDNPEHLPCLGDLFSVMWMQDSDKEDLQKETLKTQYEIVKKDTTKSHVMQYGDLSFENEPVADFQGLKKPSGNIVVNKAQDLSPVPSPDVYTYYLKQQYERASTAELKEQALKQLNWARQKRAYVDRTISYIVERVTPGTTGFATLPSLVMSQRPERLSQVECHKEVAREFGRKCFLMHKSPYAMTQSSYVLANLCEMGLPADALKNAVSGVCDSLLDKPTDVQ
jgi:legumain